MADTRTERNALAETGLTIMRPNVVETQVMASGIRLRVISKQEGASPGQQKGKTPWDLHREREKTRPKTLKRPEYKSTVVWPQKLTGLRAYLHGSGKNCARDETAKLTMDEIDRFEQALCQKNHAYASSCRMLVTPAAVRMNALLQTPMKRDDAWLESGPMEPDHVLLDPRVRWKDGCERILL